MADVFEALRADHGDMQLLLAALENSPGHSAGAGRPVLAAGKEAAKRLVIDSAWHEAAQEEHRASEHGRVTESWSKRAIASAPA